MINSKTSDASSIITLTDEELQLHFTDNYCIGSCNWTTTESYVIRGTNYTILHNNGKTMCIGNCSSNPFDKDIIENSSHTIVYGGERSICLGECS